MSTRSISLSASLLLHIALVACLTGLSLSAHHRTKNILIDFTLVKGERETGKVQAINEIGSRDPSLVPHISREQTNRHIGMSRDASETPNAEPRTPNSGSDGQVAVRGEPAGGKKGTATKLGITRSGAEGSGIPAYGSGEGTVRVLRFGDGGRDEKAFLFIRESIMKNITYPERARNRGWEGKVLLSFVVHENGSIGDIKVVKGSGFEVLDDSAREAIARTTFSQKIPVRLVVLLPVEYKLE